MTDDTRDDPKHDEQRTDAPDEPEADTPADPADEELNEDDIPEEEEGGKLGFIVIGLLVVILIVAAVINTLVYSDDEQAAPGDGGATPGAQSDAAFQQPGGGPAGPLGPQPGAGADRQAPEQPQRELTPQEHYNRALAGSQRLAAAQLYTINSRLCTIGRVPRSTGTRMMPGLLFDLENLVEGVSPVDLHRRPLGGSVMFANMLPPLGIDNGPQPVFSPSGDVTEMPREAPVIGVARGANAKAFPLSLANYHEVINTTLGDTPVAVVWSTLADAPIALERTVDGEALQFGTAGLVYKGVVVMYDTRTRSLWSSLTGRCLSGEMAGKSLARLQAQIVPWGTWTDRHPGTVIMSGTNPVFEQFDYSRDPQAPADYRQTGELVYVVSGFDLEASPLPPKARVLGITVGDATRAYPVGTLTEATSITDTLGGKEMTLTFHEDNYVTCVDADDNPVLFQRVFWIYWKGTYPETDVYGAAPRADAAEPATD